MSAPARPILRYHGGKWRIAPWIISHFPPHTLYVEPYGGAASVLMRKRPARIEILNDIDGEIVNVYRVLRDPESADELERAVRLTPFAREEFHAAYEPAEGPVERARRALVVAMMGFGSTGSGKVGRTGFRSTTHRNRSQTYAADWASYPDAIAAFTKRLRRVQIENRPALDLIAMQDASDALIYADPPYPHTTRSKVDDDGHNGYRHEMTDADHRALAEALHSCDAAVVVSGYGCPLYDEELYAGWRRVQRSAWANGKQGSERRTECLWLNDRAAVAGQASLFGHASPPGAPR